MALDLAQVWWFDDEERFERIDGSRYATASR